MQKNKKRPLIIIDCSYRRGYFGKGRCYRSREYDGNIPNVKIYIKDTSGVRYIYDKEIYEKSIELLKPYNGVILQEKVKIDLVDKLYSKEMLQGTGFYKKFKEAFKILDNIIDYDTSKKDAQHILRDIDNIDVIPKIIYDENLNLFGEYENEKENTIKQELLKLKQYKKPEQKMQ